MAVDRQIRITTECDTSFVVHIIFPLTAHLLRWRPRQRLGAPAAHPWPYWSIVRRTRSTLQGTQIPLKSTGCPLGPYSHRNTGSTQRPPRRPSNTPSPILWALDAF